MRLFKRKAVVKNSEKPLPLQLISLLCEASWLLMAGLAVYLFLVLISYSPIDPSWSHSSSDQTVRNYGGVFGAWLSDVLLHLFGLSSWWLLVFCLVGVAWGYQRIEILNFKFTSSTVAAMLGFLLLLLASASIEAMLFSRETLNLPLAAGGIIGDLIFHEIVQSLGLPGAYLLLSVLAAIGFSLFTRVSWLNITKCLARALKNGARELWQKWKRRNHRTTGKEGTKKRLAEIITETQNDEASRPPSLPSPVSSQRCSSTTGNLEQQYFYADSEERILPALALLAVPKKQQESVSQDTVQYTSRLIERKLADFGVDVKVVAAYPGPVITRYELEPAVGVKGAQVVNLMKDLSRALSLVSIRVVETIPGKTHMGLELPNPKRQIVRLSEIVSSDGYQNMLSKLTMALGKDIAGQPVSADLARMPHVLVAGTTGSGKSVAINAMILSLLYKSTPQDVRLIMIDPKMLELSIYEGIPHLLAPVVTDMKQTANALNWCVAEMERRYRLMSTLGVRNLSGFNQKIREADKAGKKISHPFSLSPETPEPLSPLPLIVVVIDELADLMMVAGKKIEELIARLAQKARAAGIHLILATQRPSVDVITGLIKANIPTRIAFQVSSKIDSRTILDQMGAETLLGQGDMLYLAPGTGYPIRVHGAFVADEEVHHVVEFLKSTGSPNYVPSILTGDSDGEAGLSPGLEGDGDSEADPLYEEAVAIVLKTRKASISSLQRHLRVGYNRAARLIEQMESTGLVSSMESNGNRVVLAPSRED